MHLNLRSQYSTGRRPSHCGPLWNVHGSGLGVFLPVLRLSLPLAGQVAKGVDWIEICSELGAIEKKVETDGTDAPDCPVCTKCALTFVTAPESVIRLVRLMRHCGLGLLTRPAWLWKAWHNSGLTIADPGRAKDRHHFNRVACL